MSPAHVRRRILLASGAVALIAVGVFALSLRHPISTLWATDHRSQERSIAYRELQWDDLIPKEWDPTKRFRKDDGSLLTDLDPKAQAMLENLRAIWDNAPTVHALDGVAVKLPGYVVPLGEVNGLLTEFLLVPYFGACIHTPPPPANQIVHVILDAPLRGFTAMDVVWVSGHLTTTRQDSPIGASGYQLNAQLVAPYRTH
jgi:uncharacterized protein